MDGCLLAVTCSKIENRETGTFITHATIHPHLGLRWFHRFDWRCKMFVWNEYQGVTAMPVALLDHNDHYLMIHCECIGEKGVQRDGEGQL